MPDNKTVSTYCGIIFVHGGPMYMACPRTYIPTNINTSICLIFIII